MKKLKPISLLLAFVLFTSSMPFSAFAESLGKYKVIAETAVIFAKPDITSDKLGEVYKNTVVNIADLSRHFGQVTVASTGITGWVQLSNLEYLGEPTGNGSITGIKVIPPTKSEYTEDIDEPDFTGLKVYAIYENGMQVTVSGYEIYCDSMDTVGTKEIRVTYTPPNSSVTFSDSFTVKVVRYPVTSLSVLSVPKKTDYLEHNMLDLTGLTVKLSYSDGRPEKIFTLDDIENDSNFKIDGCCGEKNGCRLESGTHDIRITYRYEDITDMLTVNVQPRKLISLSIKEQPNSLVTHSKDKLPDISGLVLLAEYDNGETEDIESFDCDVICDPSKFILGENNAVDVYYGEMCVRLFYKLSLNEITGIRAVPPKKLSFIVGEEIDLTGLRVQLIYSDGSLENITDYQMSEVDPERQGSQNVTVTYAGYSDVFTISITPYYRKGDVNGDGKVEPEDARLTLRSSVGYIKFSGLALNAADADNDGDITPADARLILRASVGLEKL